MYNTIISNHSGGTILESIIIEKNNDTYKYLSNIDGNLHEPIVLRPFKNENYCNPCIGYYNDDIGATLKELLEKFISTQTW